MLSLLSSLSSRLECESDEYESDESDDILTWENKWPSVRVVLSLLSSLSSRLECEAGKCGSDECNDIFKCEGKWPSLA